MVFLSVPVAWMVMQAEMAAGAVSRFVTGFCCCPVYPVYPMCLQHHASSHTCDLWQTGPLKFLSHCAVAVAGLQV